MSSFTELLFAARKGVGTRSNFGSGWALAVQDCAGRDGNGGQAGLGLHGLPSMCCVLWIVTEFKDVKAYDLLQSHANFVLRSCGADVVHHHFGVGSAACALGLPPVPGSATPPQQSTLETGLHFEAVVLAQLRKAQRSDEATRPEMI